MIDACRFSYCAPANTQGSQSAAFKFRHIIFEGPFLYRALIKSFACFLYFWVNSFLLESLLMTFFAVWALFRLDWTREYNQGNTTNLNEDHNKSTRLPRSWFLMALPESCKNCHLRQSNFAFITTPTSNSCNKYAQNQFAKNGTRQSASSNNEHYQEGIQKIVTFSHRLWFASIDIYPLLPPKLLWLRKRRCPWF